MKKIVIIILLVIAFLIAFSSTKNVIAKLFLSNGIRAMTGLKVTIKDINISIARTLIDVKGLKIYNPAGYPDKLMADIPEIYIDYDLGSIFKRGTHFEEMRLNLKEFIVVKNDKGKLNLNSLKTSKAEKKDEPKKTDKPVRKKKKTKLQIGVLWLKIGKVLYKDYSEGTPPVVKVYNVNIDEQYRNITNTDRLANLILTRALINTAIPGLADFDLQSLKEKFVETIKKTKIAGEGTFEKTEEAVDRAVEKGAEIGKKAEEKIKGAAETLEEIFPFGKKK